MDGTFSYWVDEAGFIPTARLDGRRLWHSVAHLRQLDVPWVPAAPHDMAGRIRLERLYRAVNERSFFDASTDNGDPPEVRSHFYVTLIPSAIVAWFSTHTLGEVHDQAALYQALLIMQDRLGAASVSLRGIEAKPTEPYIWRDAHESYHAAIGRHLSWAAERVQLPSSPDRDALDASDEAFEQLTKAVWEQRKLPCWHLNETKLERTSYVALKEVSDGDMFPWRRRRTANWDDFGIVAYGISAHDEHRLAGKKLDGLDDYGTVRARKLPPEEARKAREDTLWDFDYNSKEAFDFLQYARATGNAWTPWSVGGESPGGWVYFISDGNGNMKIGFTAADPTERLRALQTGSAVKLRIEGVVHGSPEKERLLHRKFADRRREGEWFQLSVSDVQNFGIQLQQVDEQRGL